MEKYFVTEKDIKDGKLSNELIFYPVERGIPLAGGSVMFPGEYMTSPYLFHPKPSFDAMSKIEEEIGKGNLMGKIPGYGFKKTPGFLVMIEKIAVPVSGLRKERERMGYTQTQMTKFLDISLRNYQRHENGELPPQDYSYSMLVKMAEILKCDIRDILREEVYCDKDVIVAPSVASNMVGQDFFFGNSVEEVLGVACKGISQALKDIFLDGKFPFKAADGQFYSMIIRAR